MIIAELRKFKEKQKKELKEKQKLENKLEDEFEDTFGELEDTADSNSGEEYDDMFSDETNNENENSLEDMLADLEKIKLKFSNIPRQTKQNVISIGGVVGNISSIDESSIKFKLNGLTQNVYLNKNGSFDNKMVLFNGDNQIDVIYDSIGGEVKESFNIKSTTPPVKARFTLTWDSYDSDMDLHVYGPDGKHCYYGSKKAGNMQLDVDNTKKYGPENISVKIGNNIGTYKVDIKHFAANSGNVTLYVYVDNQLVATKKAYLSGKEKWHAYELKISGEKKSTITR